MCQRSSFLGRIGSALLLVVVTSCKGEEKPEAPVSESTDIAKEATGLALPAPEEPPEDWDTGDAPDEEDEDPEMAANRASVALQHCAAADCPIVLSFNQAMVDSEDLATAEIPKVEVTPRVKGSWKWRTDRELVFTPEADQLLWGNTFTVRIPKLAPVAGHEYAMRNAEEFGLRVPNLVVTPKVAAYWQVKKGQPRWVGVLNGGSEAIGRGPLLLAYDQKVSAKKVKKHLTLRIGDEQLEARVFRPETVDPSRVGNLPTHYFVAVRPKLPTEATHVTVDVPSWEDGELRTRPLELEVQTEFSLTEWAFYESRWSEQIKGPKPLEVILKLAFNRGFSYGRLKDALTITPEPRALDIRGGWGEAWLHMSLDPGVHYDVEVGRDFTDVLGNRLDSRVKLDFRSKDLPPFLTVPEGPTLVEKDRASFAIKGRNLGSVSGSIVAFSSPESFAKALGAGPATGCSGLGARGPTTALPETAFPEAKNEYHTVSIPVSTTGLLCVEVAARGRGTEARSTLRAATVVQSGDIGITAKVSTGNVLAWITRLGKPAPLEGAVVRLLNSQGKTVAQQTSDAQGIVTLDAEGLAAGGGLAEPLSVVVEAGTELAVVRLLNPRLSKAWQFGLKGATGDPLYASVFTERGAYRPGETMHAKIIIGPAPWLQERKVDVEIRDSRGQKVVKRTLPLNEYGAADTALKIKKGAPVGEYAIKVTAAGRKTMRTFKVEEYRVPTFRVTVQSGAWTRGESSRAQINAKYMHGGALAGRTARWELLREPHVFAPAAFPKYLFAAGQATELAGRVAGGERLLDDAGGQQLTFIPDHPSSAGPMRYTLEATVTDVDRQAYSGRLSRVVHPASFYVGVLPPSRSVLSQGETLEVPVVAVSPKGRALAGIEVRARLERVDHHTTPRMNDGEHVQVLNREVEVTEEDCRVITKGAPVTCEFQLRAAGQYRIRAWAQDRAQRQVQAGFTVYASGDEPAAWPRFDQDRIDLVADQDTYKPGETAKLIVQSPYENAVGLLTVEREGVLSHRLITIAGDTPAIEVPIRAEHAPNIFVSVVLLRGRAHDEKDASGFETGAPGFKIGYAHLEVEPIEQRLSVTVAPTRKVVTPGSQVDLEVDLAGPDKKPAAGQVTLWVVDEAVLGLTAYSTPQPEKELYAERALGVRTGESRLELAHAKRSRYERLFPGGDGEEDEPRFSDIAVELRKLFKSTAYWNPNLEVGPDGQAKVTVELPDNITTYRIMAVAVDTAGRVGSADDKLLVKRPLIVQPVLPRFVYPGDELEVQALAFNGTPSAHEVQFVAELENLSVAKDSKTSAQVKAQAGGQAKFALPVRVTGKGEAKVRFGAAMGEHQDAVEITLPILEPGNKRTAVASKNVAGTDSVHVSIPADRVEGSLKMEVVASTTALTELKDAVTYLMRYPNGCIEQTTSTAYPLVVLKDLLPEIGVDVNMAQLKEFSTAGVKRILSFQTEGGGLSYWPGGNEPHAFATAFGLTALIAAEKRGYEVPKKALNRMADYLEKTLRKGEIREDIPHGSIADADSRALFVMTLGRLGRPQPSYIAKLWQAKDKLTPFGLSFLGIAASELPGDRSIKEPILAAVKKAAKQQADEAWFEGERKGGYSMDSPLRTHASALLAYASGAQSDAMSGKLLTGLLKRRQYGLWGNTQENVFGIMGVHRMIGSKQGGSAPQMELSIAGSVFADADMEKVSKRVRRVRLGEDKMGVVAGQPAEPGATLTNRGGKPIILTVRAEYDVPLSDNNRRAVSRGFTIERTYETMEGESIEGQPIPLGDLVRVRVQVKSDRQLNYVAIDDKLPAGLEPLNTALETTERVSLGPANDAVQRSLSLLSYQEIRDHRVAFFVDEMPAGSYEYVYVARATTPGRFLRPAGRAEAMYEPEVFGTTSIDNIVVE